MGNSDGFTAAITTQGQNIIAKFNGGYFSFAFGNEIALRLDKSSDYFILNCDEALFEEVKKEIEQGRTRDELVSFWLKKAEDYPQSGWSNSFKHLKRNEYANK